MDRRSDKAVAACSRRAAIATFAGAAFLPRAASAAADFTAGRDYVRLRSPFETWQEAELPARKPALAEASARKFQAALDQVVAAYPAHTRDRWRKLRYFLLWGPDSPAGGEPSGMRFVRPGEASRHNRDPRWQDAIVVYSADNLMYLTDLWTKKALAHEMAHAWHVANWPDRHPAIEQAWRNAVDRGLYRNVKDVKGRTLETAYAAKNPLEYFAEVSAAYFVGIDYEPYDRAGLRRHDPDGYRLVELSWSPAR